MRSVVFVVQKNKAVPRFTYCMKLLKLCSLNRSSRPKVFLGKGILKICRTITGERTCLSTSAWAFSCVCSLAFSWVLHIFRTHFPKNTSGRLLLRKWSDMKNDNKAQKSYFQNNRKNRMSHFNISVAMKHRSNNEKQRKWRFV